MNNSLRSKLVAFLVLVAPQLASSVFAFGVLTTARLEQDCAKLPLSDPMSAIGSHAETGLKGSLCLCDESLVPAETLIQIELGEVLRGSAVAQRRQNA
jgi:hypothetical protein